MTSERHSQAKELFLLLLEAPEQERLSILREKCGGDTELFQEVASLLDHNQPDTLLPPVVARAKGLMPSGLSQLTTGKLTSLGNRLARYRRLLFVGLIGLLTLVYFLISTALEKRYATFVQQNLATLRNSTADALEREFASLRRDAQLNAINVSLRNPVYGLLSRFPQTNPNDKALLAAPETAELRRFFEARISLQSIDECYVLNAAERVMFSCTDEQAYPPVTPETALFAARAMKGESTVMPPGWDFRSTSSAGPYSLRRMVWAFAPVRREDGSAEAVLLLGTAASRRIDPIVLASRIGTSGESYLFDSRGRLLTPSRFYLDFRRMGLLEENVALTATPNVILTEPGSNLMEGQPARESREARPLTRLVREAVAADGNLRAPREGQILQTYADYRGVPTLGAWRWFPKERYGLAVEIDEIEAMEKIEAMRWIFRALMLAMAIAIFYSLYTWIRMLRLRATIGAGRRLGAYQLSHKLGSGGMGVVYAAQHSLLQRMAAVKLIRNDIEDADTMKRFMAEAKLASELRHPNTVNVYDFGRSEDQMLYFAMEYLNGLDLAALMQRTGPLPPSRAIFILQQVCASLREAHSRGILHRDIKPQNIMLCEQGGEYDVVKVLDFGLACLAAGDARASETQLNQPIGTPLYMAPERLQANSRVDARSDIYCIGAVGWFLLAGREAIRPGEDFLSRVLGEKPEAPSRFSHWPVPAALDQILLSCLEKNPRDRPQSVEALRTALASITTTDEWTRREAEAWWKQSGLLEEKPSTASELLVTKLKKAVS
jgi:eukaryotic-like serine/threonine-protein kinase